MSRENVNSRAKSFFLSARHYIWSPETRRLNQDFYVKEKSLFSSLLSDSRCALDIPCGDGRLTSVIAGRSDLVVAADISETQIRNAKLRRLPNVEYLVCDAEMPPFKQGEFDLIVIWDALHYFVEPALFLIKIMPMNHPVKGQILMNVPLLQPKLERVVGKLVREIYYLPIFSIFRRYLSSKYGLPSGRDGNESAVAGVPFTIDEFHSIVRKCNLKVKKELQIPTDRPLHLIVVAEG